MTLLVEKRKQIPPEETTVLIPEARLRKRRRRLRIGVIVIMVGAIVLLASIYVGGLGNRPLTHPSASTASSNGSVAVLPVGTIINASSVVAIQMFSPTRGVAISTFWSRSYQKIEHSYLTMTNNGGISWRVEGMLPTGTSSPNFSWNPLLAFFTPRMGYIATSSPRSFRFTSNGGRTWSNVAVPGIPTALWISSGQLLATSERCSNMSGAPNCGATFLNVVRPGSLTASRDSRIPSVLPKSNSLGTTSSAYPATVIAWHQSTGVMVENHLSSLHGAHLLATANSGVTWHPLINPCPQGGQPLGQAISDSDWYFMCSAGVGMNKATNWLYRTDNAGHTWTLLAQGSLFGHNIGNIGVMSVSSFGVSKDGRYVWINGGPGFLEYSADGGRHWRFVGQHGLIPGAKTNILGPYFTSVGHDAWMPILFGGLARTTNGASWKVVGESSFP